MASTHAYVITGGHIVKTFEQFRKSFPAKVDARALKKLALAPNNESIVITLLKFLDLIDEEHNRTDAAGQLFSQHDDKDFAKELKPIVKKAYSELFDLHGENAWNLDESSLIFFFRGHDQTSAITGKRQANTFTTLVALCGFGEVPKAYAPKKKSTKSSTGASANKPLKTSEKSLVVETPKVNPPRKGQLGNFGLTVRI